jgi:thioesterase domain-containing protein
MVPAVLIRVDVLPSTATGKLDRRALARLPAPAPTTREHTQPRDAAELAIWAVWTRLLGRPPARVDADFFASGGDSLGAARLVAALAREHDLQVTLAELFEGMDVERLARRLTGAHNRQPSSARARLHELGDHPGLAWVCVLPPGQRPGLLADLAAQLTGPVWALEPASFGERGPLPELETIVTAMRSALIELGQTPFVLAGVSNGGLLAWALARSLSASDQPPRALVLLDSLPPELLAARPWHQRDALQQLATFVHQISGISVLDRLADVAPARRFAHACELALAAGVLDRSTSVDELRAIYVRYLAHGERAWRVLSTLDLGAPANNIECVLVEANEGRSGMLGQRWRERVGDLRVIPAPGGHLGMFEPPHVLELAKALNQLVAAQQTR